MCWFNCTVLKYTHQMREEFDPSDKKTLCFLLNKEHFLFPFECISRGNFNAWRIPATCSPKMTSSHFNLFNVLI